MEMRMVTIGIGMLAFTLASGTPGASAPDAKAAEILAQTRKAIGNVDAVKTLAVEASSDRNVGSMQMSSEVELLLDLPDKYVKREESRGMMAMTMAIGFNGDRAIMPAGVSHAGGAMVIRMGPGGPVSDGPRPTPEQLEKANAATVRNARVEISRLMLGWFGMAHPSLKAEYTYAGEAESPDGKAHVIDVKDADGFEARVFIDQNNHLPLMVTYKGRQPRIVTAGGPMKPPSDDERKTMVQDAETRARREMAEAPLVEFSLFFDDWREVGGITFPHVLRRAAGGETSEEWTIHAVKVNPKIDAKTFAVDTK
jgi:hypothetical protein